jgi:hypothetical protein
MTFALATVRWHENLQTHLCRSFSVISSQNSLAICTVAQCNMLVRFLPFLLAFFLCLYVASLSRQHPDRQEDYEEMNTMTKLGQQHMVDDLIRSPGGMDFAGILQIWTTTRVPSTLT